MSCILNTHASASDYHVRWEAIELTSSKAPYRCALVRQQHFPADRNAYYKQRPGGDGERELVSVAVSSQPVDQRRTLLDLVSLGTSRVEQPSTHSADLRASKYLAEYIRAVS